MPTFQYTAIDRIGKKSQGSVAAESISAARKQLRNRRLHATKLRPISEAAHSSSAGMGWMFSGRKKRTLLEFTRQLATMIKAEVKLTEALGVQISQATDPKFGQMLQNIRDQLLAGENLAEGLKEYPGWFDPIYVAMVRVGEATGNLGRSLTLLADHIGKRHKMEAKIKSALTYPAILVVVCFIVVILLMTVVVPELSKIITARNKELPAATDFLLDVSDFMIRYWWLIIIMLIAGRYMFKKALANPKGRLKFDRFILRIPVIGELIRQSVVARFTSTLAALIRSGMPVAEGLRIVAAVTGNAVMTNAVNLARERIVGGADVATPLRESKVVGVATAHMISVGERTGELESMLLTISESLEENTDITVMRISSVIEPIIIIIMAVIVGFIIYAVIMPIMEVSNIG